MSIIKWIKNIMEIPMLVIGIFVILYDIGFLWFSIKGLFKHDSSEIKGVLEESAKLYKKSPLLYNVFFIIITTCLLITSDFATPFGFICFSIMIGNIIFAWLSAIWYLEHRNKKVKKLEVLYRKLMMIRLKYLVGEKTNKYLKAAQELISERIEGHFKNIFEEDMKCPLESRKKFKETVDKYSLQLVAASKTGLVFIGDPDYSFYEELIYFENAVADVLNWSYFSTPIVSVVNNQIWEKSNDADTFANVDVTEEEKVISDIAKLENRI